MVRRVFACALPSGTMSGEEALTYAHGAVRLQQQGRLVEAVDSYRRAVSLDPNSADLACNFGAALAAIKDWPAACEAYQQALRLRPDFPEVACNLGNALKELGQIDEAIQSYEHALELRPTFAEAYFNLGNTYYSIGDGPKAVEAFQKALERRPDFAKAANNLGNTFRLMGQLEQAQAAYLAASRLKANYPAALCNLAVIAYSQGKPTEAMQALEELLAAYPSDLDVHINMGAVLIELSRLDDALSHYGRAIELSPDYAEPRFQRSIIYLLRGNLGRGFADYEWRQHLRGKTWVNYRQPRWEGTSLVGRTILLPAEQGAGDVLQFIRYVPLVKQFGGTIVVGCYPNLARLLSTVPGVDRVLETGDKLPQFEVYAALGSLPNILGTTLSTIPAEVPYLFAEPGLVDRWKQRVNGGDGLRVGLAWQGNPLHARDQSRSMPLSSCLPLASIPGVQLYSLQKGFGSEQLEGLDPAVSIIDWGNLFEDYADAAAALCNLDLIISVDTSVAHLAGALGRPTWILLSHAPDWRWLLARDTSPWYPTARLFRQHELGKWDNVIERVGRALKETASIQSQEKADQRADGAGHE